MVWSSAIAQTYTGRIEDSENKQAIEFANIVVLQKSDNKYLTGVTSAEDGSFCIRIDSGTPFYIVVRSIGYESVQISTLTQENLGTILLSRPLKTIFQHKVCTDKLYADSFYKVQKSSHSSFEVICCGS